VKKLTTALSLTAVLALGAQSATLDERVKALEEQNEVITEEVLASQSAGFTTIDTDQSYAGMGAAASKVYYSKSPLSIGGYGEMYYANPDNGDDFADVYRFVTYVGYRFSDNIILNTEIEYEHGGSADGNPGGKVVVEFMYLDFLWKDEINFRVGNLLVPMGIVNLRHEPVLFNTVQRPEVETVLLPSTWGENGVMAYGRFDSLSIDYSAGIVNALNLDSSRTQNADRKWIRSGRIGATNEGSWSPAFVARVDYTGINGLLAGVSGYYGGASNLKDDANAISGVNATIFDIHAIYDNGPFSAYGLYTQTSVDGDLGPSAAKKGSGYYVNLAYDVSELIGISQKLPIFVQYSNFNPVSETVDGLNEDAQQTESVIAGFNLFVHDQATLKFEYEKKEINNVSQNIFSTGFAFIF